MLRDFLVVTSVELIHRLQHFQCGKFGRINNLARVVTWSEIDLHGQTLIESGGNFAGPVPRSNPFKQFGVQQFVRNHIDVRALRSKDHADSRANEMRAAVPVGFERENRCWIVQEHHQRFRSRCAEHLFDSCLGLRLNLEDCLSFDLAA
jgi:hypothetical protein